MFCSSHRRRYLLSIALIAGAMFAGAAVAQEASTVPQALTTVHLRWGSRPGVSRYRLQLARDRGFADIVFDRVVQGTEIDINDLDPGIYFWRIAALTANLGDFSSAGTIEVKAVAQPQPSASPAIVRPGAVETGGGWRAAIGNISQVIPARLRSAGGSDIVALTSVGALYAIDSSTGVALWSTRSSEVATARLALSRILLATPNRSRLDNVLIINGALVREVEGSTGRELWRSTVPAPAAAATVIDDPGGAKIVIVDISRQRLFVVHETNGHLVGQTNLTARVVGSPVALNGEGDHAFAVSFDNGDLQVRDNAGTLVRTVNVSSPATTAPIFVRGRNTDLLLVGTREGLNALIADDLRPLGRVSIPDDAPRGTLTAQDLDNDGLAEIIMTTERRHLVAVNSADGKTLWNVPATDYGDSLAFADVDGDQVSDVLVDAGQRFAIVLSGRDGRVIWAGERETVQATNHAASTETGELIALPSNAGVVLIGRDTSQPGLRALTFFKAAVRPASR